MGGWNVGVVGVAHLNPGGRGHQSFFWNVDLVVVVGVGVVGVALSYLSCV